MAINQAQPVVEVVTPAIAVPDGVAPLGVELRHLRYFVAVAEAGTFTHAAQRMFIASRRSASRSAASRR
jgi:Bacterial regulatory helix-turn-helix protein, lysR family